VFTFSDHGARDVKGGAHAFTIPRLALLQMGQCIIKPFLLRSPP
jgi:hypothetical protein